MRKINVNEAKKGTSLLHILEVIPAGGGGGLQQWGGATTMAACLCLPLLPKAVISDPSDPWYLNKVLFSYPGSHKLCKLHMAGSTDGVVSTGLRAESHQY